MTQIIQANWPAPSHIRAFTTTRQGGHSLDPYSSFNMGDHVGDTTSAVQQNRALLRKEYALPNEPAWLSQHHSTKIVFIDDCYQICEADASYTSFDNTVCAVLTADCLPLLVCNQDGTEIAAIHAGWRGLADGIIENSIGTLNSDPEDLLVWLGPAASGTLYEVGADVYNTFLQQDPKAKSAFIEAREKKYLMDIYHLARQRLENLGVNAIYGGDYCTINQQELFYSYRREGTTGRMASLIWKMPE